MWQVVQRGNVQDYGMVEEFISTVSEIVPELLNADQKAQLLLGLRARVSETVRCFCGVLSEDICWFNKEAQCVKCHQPFGFSQADV